MITRFDKNGSITRESARQAARQGLLEHLEHHLTVDNETIYDSVRHVLQTSYGNRNGEQEREILDGELEQAIELARTALIEVLL